MFICLRPPPLLGFSLGWSSNFVGSESGQIQSVKLLQNTVSNRAQHPPPLPSYTLSVYTVLWQREGGRSWTREKVRGATVHKAGSKIPTWLTVSPVYKIWWTPGAKSLCRSISFRCRHFASVSESARKLFPLRLRLTEPTRKSFDRIFSQPGNVRGVAEVVLFTLIQRGNTVCLVVTE